MIKLNWIIPIIFCLFLTSCYEIHTESTFSADLKQGYSISKPIYLKIKDTDESRMYLMLEKNIHEDEFFMKLRWEAKNSKKNLLARHTTINFILDNQVLISENPIKDTRVVSYSLDKGTITEEAVFKFTREDLDAIASSKEVIIDVITKSETKRASFTKLHSHKAFRDFLKKS